MSSFSKTKLAASKIGPIFSHLRFGPSHSFARALSLFATLLQLQRRAGEGLSLFSQQSLFFF